MAASVTVSPKSTNPPGNVHRPRPGIDRAPRQRRRPSCLGNRRRDDLGVQVEHEPAARADFLLAMIGRHWLRRERRAPHSGQKRIVVGPMMTGLLATDPSLNHPGRLDTSREAGAAANATVTLPMFLLRARRPQCHASPSPSSSRRSRSLSAARRPPFADSRRPVNTRSGVLEPLTGPLAVRGQAPHGGLEVGARPHQRAGRRDGQEARLRGRRRATDPTAAASRGPHRLTTREGVKIITGTFSSRLCGAASEVAARHNVIYWESSCVDPRFNKRGLKYVYRTEIDATGFGWYNIEFIAKHLTPRLNLKPNQLEGRVPVRGFLLRPGRDRVSPATGEDRVRHAGGDASEYYNLDDAQRHDADHPQDEAAQSRRRASHRLRQRCGAFFWRQSKGRTSCSRPFVHAGATGYGGGDFGKALGNDANGVFALLEPGPGFRLEALRPEGPADREPSATPCRSDTGT